MGRIAANPVGVLVAFRWSAWAIALVGVLFGAGAAEHGVSRGALLGVTGLALVAETALAFRLEGAAPGVTRARRLMLAVAAADAGLGLIAVYLSGGWSSPFYHYAVTALLVPAFLLSLGPALFWAVGFVAAYVGVCFADAGYDGDLGALLGRRVGTGATPLIVVAVVWFFARLIEQRQRAREQAERALAQTATLVQVSEAMAAHLATPGAMLDAVAEAARRSGLFRTFVVRLADEGSDGGGWGFGSVDGADRALTLPLEVREEALGTLTVAPAGGVSFLGADGASAGTGFLETLARQTALGVYDARLFAQREELATQAERARIAREIHDGMAQSLYMLSLGLEACVDAAQGQDGELARRLQALVGVSKQALWEARRYIFDLTPAAEGEPSLVVMLGNLVREFETVSRVPARLVVEGEQRPVPAPVAAALYRIGQEALANVFKHAQAGRVDVTLCFLPGALRLAVADDGRGLPERPGGGHGLANMRRRAEECGGVCRVTARPGGGTVVEVGLPDAEGERAAALPASRVAGEA